MILFKPTQTRGAGAEPAATVRLHSGAIIAAAILFLACIRPSFAAVLQLAANDAPAVPAPVQTVAALQGGHRRHGLDAGPAPRWY